MYTVSFTLSPCMFTLTEIVPYYILIMHVRTVELDYAE